MRGMAIIFFGLVIAACSSDPRAQGAVAVTATSGAVDDDHDLFDANVVANLAGPQFQATVFCSGILLSRTRVLTAAHCVTGVLNTSVGPSPNVQVGSVVLGTTFGPGLASDTPPAVPITEIDHYTDPDNLSDVGADLAILVLDEAPLDAQVLHFVTDQSYPGAQAAYASSIDSSNWGNLLGTNVGRPSFATPTENAIGFAYWGEETNRQLRTFTATSYALGANSFSVRASGASPGDSGSPLFAIRADGSRDPFGILSGGDGSDDTYFVDLTSLQNSRWIASHMIDHTHDAQPNWKKKHPLVLGHSEWWIGDDDYSGPCNSALDVDCDHWADSSDNCPDVFNHDQTDTDDDGIGDACSD